MNQVLSDWLQECNITKNYKKKQSKKILHNQNSVFDVHSPFDVHSLFKLYSLQLLFLSIVTVSSSYNRCYHFLYCTFPSLLFLFQMVRYNLKNGKWSCYWKVISRFHKENWYMLVRRLKSQEIHTPNYWCKLICMCRMHIFLAHVWA